MAVEALALEYRFLPKTNHRSFQALAASKAGKKKAEPAESHNPKDLPFIHFALHDLESILWIGMYMVFYHRTDRDADERVDIKRKRRAETAAIFPGTSNYSYREDFIEKENDFTKRVEAWLPDAFFSFAASCQNLFDSLVACYRSIEATFPQGLGRLMEEATQQHPHQPAFPGALEATEIHAQFREAFLEQIEDSDDIRLIPVTELIEVAAKDETEADGVDGPSSRKRKSKGAHGSRKRTKTNT